MRARLFIVGSAVVIVTASIAVITAQHREVAGSSAQVAVSHELQFLHAACAQAHALEGQPAKPHIPAHFATALDLTSAQLTEIERMAGEACSVMARIHEGMMGVLTPEQRAKVQELHKGGHGDGVIAWLKKLHGSK